MSYKNLVEAWSSYKHPDRKLTLELDDSQQCLLVLEPISKNEVIRFTSKIKVKVLRMILELLGFEPIK